MPLSALAALSDRLRCEAHFFEAHFNLPKDYDKSKDVWYMTPEMHRLFKEPPLASYSYFKKLESAIWNLQILKPVREKFDFLPYYELTFLEARATSLGEVYYRFEQKIAEQSSVQFSVDTQKPDIRFMEHRGEFDIFLYLTCNPQ